MLEGICRRHLLDFDWLWSTVAMVIVIEWQIVIDDKFYEMGPSQSKSRMSLYLSLNDKFSLMKSSMQWAPGALADEWYYTFNKWGRVRESLLPRTLIILGPWWRFNEQFQLPTPSRHLFWITSKCIHVNDCLALSAYTVMIYFTHLLMHGSILLCNVGQAEQDVLVPLFCDILQDRVVKIRKNILYELLFCDYARVFSRFFKMISVFFFYTYPCHACHDSSIAFACNVQITLCTQNGSKMHWLAST